MIYITGMGFLRRSKQALSTETVITEKSPTAELPTYSTSSKASDFNYTSFSKRDAFRLAVARAIKDAQRLSIFVEEKIGEPVSNTEVDMYAIEGEIEESVDDESEQLLRRKYQFQAHDILDEIKLTLEGGMRVHIERYTRYYSQTTDDFLADYNRIWNLFQDIDKLNARFLQL